MTNTQTHKNPRDLTQRVLLLAYLVIFFAPCCFEFEGETSLNSTDHNGMKQAVLLYPKTAQIQTIAPAINPPFVGCSFSKKWITES